MNKVIHALLTMTILSGIVLSSSLVIAEDNEVIDTIELTVPVACTMGGTGQTSHNASIDPGTYSGASGSEYEAGIGKTTITTYCNDNNGFSIYAIGFTNDLYEGEPHTKLIGQNTNQTIATKVYANGDTDSNWSMKVSKVDNPVSGDPVTYNPDNMSIQNSFNSWHTVPDVYTKVAQYNSNTTDPATTDTTLGAKIETTYATYISSAQAADTYKGQVKYTMVHPYNHTDPEPPFFQVFYTGRPASTEPGEENPVKIRMSELPASGKYNLLGTEDGLYDKLTEETYYGGYYKDIVDSPSEFVYTNESDVYDGTNFNWLIKQPETTDAAEITPEDGVTYYVKELNSTRYLRWSIWYTYSSDKILDIFYMTDTDDENYSRVGFIFLTSDGTYDIAVDNLLDALTITPVNNPNNASTHTAASRFKAYGDNNMLGYWKDRNKIFLDNEDMEPFTFYAYWVTADGYKMTAGRERHVEPNGWYVSAFTGETIYITPTISKWEGV